MLKVKIILLCFLPVLLHRTLALLTGMFVHVHLHVQLNSDTVKKIDQKVTVHIRPNGTAFVEFEKPVKAVTLGQVAVFYDNDVCLGSAIIDEVIKLDASTATAAS